MPGLRPHRMRDELLIGGKLRSQLFQLGLLMVRTMEYVGRVCAGP